MQSSIQIREIYYGFKTCSTGQVFQVRNHVKMYPWRKNRTIPESHLDTTKTPYTDRHNINEFEIEKRKMKPWMRVVYKDKDNRFTKYQWHEAYTSDPAEAKSIASDRLSRFIQSLKARGHAREVRCYNPPDDVQQRIFSLLAVMDTGADEASLLKLDLNRSIDLKYDLITKCIETFDHDLPSSVLNDIHSVEDLIEYFSTPVRGISPYDALTNKSDTLPPNLAIISAPIRYDKENDQFFGGYTALPGIVSEVPGLRAKKIYEKLNQDEFQWPDI